MTLNPEWLHRVQNWKRELPKHFYTPFGVVEWVGYTTTELLPPEEARKGEFKPMPAGTPWGKKWDYAWFKGALTLPPEAAGKRIVLRPELGGQALVWAEGRLLGCRDREHAEMTLAMRGVSGKKYSLLANCYAGHGDWVVGEGPVAFGVSGVPEPPEPITQMGKTTFGVWNDEVYQLWIDVETLHQLRDELDPDSLRVAEIDAGLRDFTLIADLELPFDEMLETIRAARARLKPLLECTNGSTAPLLYTIGHGHMDVAWLWRLRETEFKITGTLANQLELAAEYPEHKFIQSQPHLFWMIKTLFPEVYDELKAAVRAGHIVPEGGMWVEADTNLSGGEALIRQFLYGKRFFRDEFGVECELLWLPDVFGYSGQMPQIMRGCGIQYFATQKIFWTYNGGDKFPHNLFTWQGIDGSEVLAHIFNDYNSQTDPHSLNRRWKDRVQKDGLKGLVVAFGWGDGGGGPTRDHLEFLRRCRDLEGAPRTKMASPVEFFKAVEQDGLPDEHYVGELYFQAHRGTYTSQAKTKKNNRKAELALREAEMWGAIAQATRKGSYPWRALSETWRTVMLHQFHDILPGSSIQAVYQEAEAAMGGAVAAAEDLARASMQAIAGTGEPITAFNSLSWERTALVPLPPAASGLADAEGRALPVQRDREGDPWAEVTLPACGWATFHAIPAAKPSPEGSAARVGMSPPALENEHLRLEFDELGELSSIYDKDAHRELAAAPGNSFRMFKDVPNWFDAWDIDSMAEQQPVPLTAPAQFEVVNEGPLVAGLRITRKLHHSEMTQVVRLRRGSRRADFETEIDWQERHKLLKVAFPVNIHADEAIHEIQFGHIRRPTHRSRPFDANRFEVCNHKWTALAEENRGCAVLNDSKYGVSVLGNTIGLTLLKSALAPDPVADLGRQTFTYAFYAWNGSFAEANIVREGYELNVPVHVAPGAGGNFSFLSVDAPNIVVETLKSAEDDSGELVVRLYEAKRMATRCLLAVAAPVYAAAECDMLENKERDLAVDDGRIALEFRPFEIKTIRVRV